jgi:hypothetical protein
VIGLSHYLDRIFDILVSPFGNAAAGAVLAVAAVVTVVVLAVFKAATPQKRLVAARDRVLGHIFEMGLYQERLGVLAKIQRDLAWSNLRYVVLVLPALALMIVPVALAMYQLEGRVGRRPFQPGETTLVAATLAADQAAQLERLTLATSPGLVLDAPPVRAADQRTAFWRVRVTTPGRHEVAISSPQGALGSLPVAAEAGLQRVEKERRRESGLAALIGGRQDVLPTESGLTRLAIRVPDRHVRYLGVELSWLLAFILATLVLGLALKGVFRVEF